jgi:hypothetical protein
MKKAVGIKKRNRRMKKMYGEEKDLHSYSNLF